MRVGGENEDADRWAPAALEGHHGGGLRVCPLEVEAPRPRHRHLQQLGEEVHAPLVVAVAALLVLRHLSHDRRELPGPDTAGLVR